MQFSLMADCFENVEATSKRLVMIEHLVELFSSASKDVIDKIVYLTQGKLAAEFANVELGIAEKLAVQAVVRAAGRSQKEIRGDLERTGDIGKTAEKFLAKGTQATLFRGSPLTVQEVHDTLNKIARESGVGSTDRKLNLLTGLLTSMTPKEAKYILRIVTGNLRLGIADMTVLDALAIAFGGGKEARSKLERAYNISSDLGEVARKVAEKGLQAISNFKVALGNPIRPMLAERLGAPEEILEKLGGTCSAEFKYDGERVQAHKQDDQVVLYSRRLENITGQYPDAVELVKKHVKAKTAIIEAEIVAVDVDTEEMKPFKN